jgi:ABC-2 type transport system permease protein
MEPAPTGSPYQQQQGQLVPVNTGLERLLDHYGVKVNQSLVLDENCFKQRLPEQYGGGEQNIYFAPIIEAGQINSKLDFIKNIKQFIAYKISPLSLNDQQIKNNKLKTIKLFSSSEKSWEMKGQIMLNPMFIRPPAGGDGMESRPLAYIIEGSFPSYFTHKPIPEKPADNATPPAKQENLRGNVAQKASTANQLEQRGGFLSSSKPTKIFILGSSEMLTDNLISEQADNTNTTLIMNVIDVLNNKEDIALMRSKVQTFNPLDVKDEKVKVTAKFFNIAGLPVIVVIFGMLVLIRRHNRKKRIEAAF